MSPGQGVSDTARVTSSTPRRAVTVPLARDFPLPLLPLVELRGGFPPPIMLLAVLLGRRAEEILIVRGGRAALAYRLPLVIVVIIIFLLLRLRLAGRGR